MTTASWVLAGLLGFAVLIIIAMAIIVNNITGLFGEGVRAWIEGWAKR